MFTTRYLKENLLICCAAKYEHGKMIDYPLGHDNHKVLLNYLVTTYHERSRKKNEYEVIKVICLDECKYGVNVLAL